MKSNFGMKLLRKKSIKYVMKSNFGMNLLRKKIIKREPGILNSFLLLL